MADKPDGKLSWGISAADLYFEGYVELPVIQGPGGKKVAIDRREWIDGLPLGKRRLLQAHRDSVLGEWVINPVWLSWPLYAVVRASREKVWQSDEDIVRAVREITEERENLAWHDRGPAVVRAVLELTELCLYSNGRYFFPRGLPADGTPILPDWAKPSCQEAYKEAYHAELEWTFLAESVIHRLMVRWYSSIVDGKHWRHGMVIREGVVDATIVADTDKATLQVHVMGGSSHECERLYEKIRHDLVHGFVGKEPNKESSPWIIVSSPHRLPQTMGEPDEDRVLKLVETLERTAIIEVTPQVRLLLSELFIETTTLSPKRRMAYRVYYFY